MPRRADAATIAAKGRGRRTPDRACRTALHPRWRRCIVAVGAALPLALTACLAPPPRASTQTTASEEYCAPSAPTSSTAYADAFDGLRHATDWLSGDTAVPVLLPDGRTVWLFGDTYVGALTSTNTIDPNSPFVRNSFVVQTGACFQPLIGGTPGARSSLIPSPGPNEWYWPASGLVESGVLRVFLWDVTRSGSGPLGFTVLDMRVATFGLPTLQLESIQALPFPTSAAQPYGSTAFVGSDGYAYLYGESQRNVYVARAPVGQIMTAAAWQFWGTVGVGSGWSSNPAAATPTQWVDLPTVPGSGTGQGPKAQPWVRPNGSGYLATAKLADDLSDDVSVFTAPSPAGPWTYYGSIASTAASGLMAYDAWTNVLPGTSNPTLVYSTNLVSPGVVPLSGQTYGPHFEAVATGALPSS